LALPVTISDFSFQYWKDAPFALKDITLSVRPGTICALLGPTNAGKSTLLQALAGILGEHHRQAIASGTVKIGEDTFSPIPRNVLFPTVGLTLQDPYYQISGIRERVWKEVGLTLEAYSLTESEIESRVKTLLERLGLHHLSERKPSTLSGGELQRVALANILIAQPQVLLLDEPCHSLDGTSQRRLASILCSLQGSTTVIVADYQLDFALRVAEQFVVVDTGRIAFNGDRSQFLTNLHTFRSLLPVDVLEQALTNNAVVALSQRLIKNMAKK